MGFWTEWALQCYRAVMFPVHWLLGLEAYAVDMDDYDLCGKCGGYAGGSDGVCLPCSLDGYVCGCPGQDCEECLNQ